jgi:hypothetical protein
VAITSHNLAIHGHHVIVRTATRVIGADVAELTNVCGFLTDAEASVTHATAYK